MMTTDQTIKIELLVQFGCDDLLNVIEILLTENWKFDYIHETEGRKYIKIGLYRIIKK